MSKTIYKPSKLGHTGIDTSEFQGGKLFFVAACITVFCL